MEDWRENIYEQTLVVEGKIEYVEGDADVIFMDGGGIVIAKEGKRVSVAVWKNGGYDIWIWNGRKWTIIEDRRRAG